MPATTSKDLPTDFYSLKISKILSYTLNQSASFYLVLIYLIFEYLRPQDMYPIINFMPWGLVLLMSCLAATLLEGKFLKVKNSANQLLILYLFVILISSFSAISFEESINGYKKFIVLLLAYFIIINCVNDLKKFFVFTGLYILLSFKLAQFNAIRYVLRGFTYDAYAAFSGMAWLKNPGELAIQMCILFAVSFFFCLSTWNDTKSWVKRSILIIIPISAVLAVLSCGSRGSFIALAAVFFLMVMSTKRKISGLILILLLILSIPTVMSERDKHRTLNMGGENDTTASNRIERWEKGLDMVRQNPFIGVGYNNWAVADKKYYNGSGALSHNIFIECASELGLMGLSVFILLIVSTLKNNFETIRISVENQIVFSKNMAKSLNLALVAYLIAGFFVTILYYPYFWINLAMSVSLNNAVKNNT